MYLGHKMQTDPCFHDLIQIDGKYDLNLLLKNGLNPRNHALIIDVLQ